MGNATPRRVGIVALLHESNTFLPKRTGLDDFRDDVLLSGGEVARRFAGTPHEVGGFFEGLAGAAIKPVPIFAGRAIPSGTIEAGAYDALIGMMTKALEGAGPLDGVLAAAHGATVSEAHPDVDGHWLGLLRRRLGPGTPIIGTLDLHANVSPAMIEACDALIPYRTNPHLDQRERGVDAARLMAATLRGEAHPTMAATFPPLLVNIERQHTAEEPCRSLFEAADRQGREPGVLSAGVVLGFPYADVAEMGASAIVVTDGDAPAAARRAADLGRVLWARRREFEGRLIPVEDAVARAASLEGPVGLLDMGDNVGGGSPGDGTLLVHELSRQGLLPAFACLVDPDGAARAEAGRRLRLSVGGKCDRLHGAPFEDEFAIAAVFDGRFEETQVRHGGFARFDQGRTAVAVTDRGLTLMLTTRRVPPFSLRQLTAFGIDPRSFRALVIKGVHAPVAAYRDACRPLIRVDTPGVTTADPARMVYSCRRRPMAPFEPECDWTPVAVSRG